MADNENFKHIVHVSNKFCEQVANLQMNSEGLPKVKIEGKTVKPTLQQFEQYLERVESFENKSLDLFKGDLLKPAMAFIMSRGKKVTHLELDDKDKLMKLKEDLNGSKLSDLEYDQQKMLQHCLLINNRSASFGINNDNGDEFTLINDIATAFYNKLSETYYNKSSINPQLHKSFEIIFNS